MTTPIKSISSPTVGSPLKASWAQDVALNINTVNKTIDNQTRRRNDNNTSAFEVIDRQYAKDGNWYGLIKGGKFIDYGGATVALTWEKAIDDLTKDTLTESEVDTTTTCWVKLPKSGSYTYHIDFNDMKIKRKETDPTAGMFVVLSAKHETEQGTNSETITIKNHTEGDIDLSVYGDFHTTPYKADSTQMVYVNGGRVIVRNHKCSTTNNPPLVIRTLAKSKFDLSNGNKLYVKCTFSGGLGGGQLFNTAQFICNNKDSENADKAPTPAAGLLNAGATVEAAQIMYPIASSGAYSYHGGGAIYIDPPTNIVSTGNSYGFAVINRFVDDYNYPYFNQRTLSPVIVDFNDTVSVTPIKITGTANNIDFTGGGITARLKIIKDLPNQSTGPTIGSIDTAAGVVIGMNVHDSVADPTSVTEVHIPSPLGDFTGRVKFRQLVTGQSTPNTLGSIDYENGLTTAVNSQAPDPQNIHYIDIPASSGSNAPSYHFPLQVTCDDPEASQLAFTVRGFKWTNDGVTFHDIAGVSSSGGSIWIEMTKTSGDDTWANPTVNIVTGNGGAEVEFDSNGEVSKIRHLVAITNGATVTQIATGNVHFLRSVANGALSLKPTFIGGLA